MTRAADWLRASVTPARDYRLTRWLVLRLLGVVYLFAFLGIVLQGLPLLGSHGLTPMANLVDRLHGAHLGFLDVPSVFMWGSSDTAITTWAYVGVALSLVVVAGYANLPILLVLWLVYGSYERLGQLWFGFGWEIQLVETGLLAAFLAHPWDPRPLAAPSPPRLAIILVRWLVFRIMFGAGMIKAHGSGCWADLTCLDAHFETQPIPNPLSAGLHHLPHAVHAGGVMLNHVVELVMPFFVFGPRFLRLVAACAMGLFQVILIISGNLAFLNWLTLVPILAVLDDDALRRVLPARVRTWLSARMPARPPGRGHRIAVAIFAVLVAIKSVAVVENLVSSKQAMNRSYDRLALVNTYGAFGSVGMVRHELVIEGTMDADPTSATWREYELPCKPGALDRRPCLLGPYHLRLDWLIWFAAMVEPEQTPWSSPPDAGPDRRTASVVWMMHVVYKLLDGDTGLRELFAVDPFHGEPPLWIRIRRFVYHLEPYGAPAWWQRDHDELWLSPVSLDTPEMRELLNASGMPSPTLRN